MLKLLLLIVSLLCEVFSAESSHDILRDFLGKTRATSVVVQSDGIKGNICLGMDLLLPPNQSFQYLLLEDQKKLNIPGDVSADPHCIQLFNDSDLSVFIRFTLSQPFSLLSGSHVLRAPESFYIHDVQPESGYLNAVSVSPAKSIECPASIQLAHSLTATSLLPRLFHSWNHWAAADKGQVPPPYVRAFLDRLVPKFAGSVAVYKAHLQSLYDQFLRQVDMPLREGIPLITHTIWFTSLLKPKFPCDEAFLMYQQTIKRLKGWRHILWVAHLGIDSELEKNPTGSDDINACVEVKSFVSEFGQDPYFSLLHNATALHYAQQSDWGRLLILKKYGGVYRDTDIRFLLDVRDLHQMCQFYAGLEGGDASVLGNAVIGSVPNHPILQQTLDIIVGRCKADAALRMPILSDPVVGTLFKTGAFPLTEALFRATQAAESINSYVTVLPPHVFYCPPFNKKREPRLTWPTASLTEHAHHKSWVSDAKEILAD